MFPRLPSSHWRGRLVRPHSLPQRGRQTTVRIPASQFVLAGAFGLPSLSTVKGQLCPCRRLIQPALHSFHVRATLPRLRCPAAYTGVLWRLTGRAGFSRLLLPHSTAKREGKHMFAILFLILSHPARLTSTLCRKGTDKQMFISDFVQQKKDGFRRPSLGLESWFESCL